MKALKIVAAIFGGAVLIFMLDKVLGLPTSMDARMIVHNVFVMIWGIMILRAT